MYRLKILIIFFSFSGLILSCKNESGGKQANNDQQEIKTLATSTNSEDKFYTIPQSIIMEVWNEADLLDYIFHDLPFSMSQDQQASIRTNVTYIAQEAQASIPAGCKPIGKQFFAKQGNIFLEADIYFDDNCRFYVFFQNEKAVYANKMSPAGVNFFNAMISQALNATGG